MAQGAHLIVVNHALLLSDLTTSGSILGIWQHPTTGSYSNPDSVLFLDNPDPLDPKQFPLWTRAYGLKGTGGNGDTYMVGDLVFGNDAAGYTRLSGQMTYMDTLYTGQIGLEYRGAYGGSYDYVGVGTAVLDPLHFSLVASGTLLLNSTGQPVTAGEHRGIIGSTAGPFPELGTIAAMGTQPGRILSMFVIEGFALGVFGAVAGSVAGEAPGLVEPCSSCSCSSSSARTNGGRPAAARNALIRERNCLLFWIMVGPLR